MGCWLGYVQHLHLDSDRVDFRITVDVGNVLPSGGRILRHMAVSLAYVAWCVRSLRRAHLHAISPRPGRQEGRKVLMSL